MKIQLVRTQSTYSKIDPDEIKVNEKAASVTFGPGVIERLGAKDGDYLMIGKVGSTFYVCKKPAGFFGIKLNKNKASGSNFTASIGAEVKAGLKGGQYLLGESVPQKEKDAQGREVDVIWY